MFKQDKEPRGRILFFQLGDA